jgi:hypothetical protein
LTFFYGTAKLIVVVILTHIDRIKKYQVYVNLVVVT